MYFFVSQISKESRTKQTKLQANGTKGGKGGEIINFQNARPLYDRLGCFKIRTAKDLRALHEMFVQHNSQTYSHINLPPNAGEIAIMLVTSEWLYKKNQTSVGRSRKTEYPNRFCRKIKLEWRFGFSSYGPIQ